jgi:hypothetical protein
VTGHPAGPHPAPVTDTGLVPARPLAAQAHALRAAAAFLERTGLASLALSFSGDRISIQVPADLADPASRTAAVARLAAALGGQPTRNQAPGATRGWIHADGQLAGHPVDVYTPIEP